ncbi:DNA adenine methylase [Xenorhabdus sp. Sc-CR9]|uniref:DNA adenine methylase n=1 Tax=Xenorhabdus sp. Sc-CR9 TaxID=2584468 RepID=UPI001F029C33|nr:Dam family site-specific DNA-(adenine-N6)-methyltransferase [Xenorhabdus sp. Sc-CR9]
MTNKTILKWAGSKARIIDKLLPHLPAGRRLVEPFAGSCAVMMNTDYPAYLVADVNADLINFYWFVVNFPEFVTAEGERLFRRNHEADYYRIRESFNNGEKRTNFNTYNAGNGWQAFWFLYLNRHGYNGLCRYNAAGKFNTPFGHYKRTYFPKAEIDAFVLKAGAADVSLLHLEWQDTLTLVDYGDVVYCDPPYLGTFSQYHQSVFAQADHEALAMDLYTLNAHLGVPVTVSNSIAANELYTDLGFTVHEINAPRNIAANGNRQPAKEIIAVLRGRV